MDILVYDKLKDALDKMFVDFNEQTGYGVTVVKQEPQNPEYPLVVLEETRNVPRTRWFTRRQEISSMGYTVKIYAKSKTVTPKDGKKTAVDKQTMCRVIMDFITNFMQRVIGLQHISTNQNPINGTQGEVYGLILVFQGYHNDNREIFI